MNKLTSLVVVLIYCLVQFCSVQCIHPENECDLEDGSDIIEKQIRDVEVKVDAKVEKVDRNVCQLEHRLKELEEKMDIVLRLLQDKDTSTTAASTTISATEETQLDTTQMPSTTSGSTQLKTCPALREASPCKCIHVAQGLSVICDDKTLYSDIKNWFKAWDESLPREADRSVYKLKAYAIQFKSNPHHIESDFLANFRVDDIDIAFSEIDSFNSKAFETSTRIGLYSGRLTNGAIDLRLFSPHLKQVSLTSNRLTSVPWFPPTLASFDLGSNEITEVGSIQFTGTFIALHQNRISSVKRNAFRPKASQKIFLHLNMLRDDSLEEGFINCTSLKGTANLVDLYLWNNRLTSVSQVIFAPFLDIKSIVRFDDNPLQCDCRMKWLLEKHFSSLPESDLSAKFRGIVCPDGGQFFTKKRFDVMSKC